MSQNILAVSLPDLIKQRLDRLADATNRSPALLATEALDEYLARQEWQLDAVDEAVREADKGVFVSNDAVTDWLNSWGGPAELPPPEPDHFKKPA